ncbi:putative nucleoredoxin 1 [Apium graveolens]|uniref:putative nucleoredoxin 1 n=1 Tax=Apium graveolens TaxID=4045 RepID=UPI003D7ACF93
MMSMARGLRLGIMFSRRRNCNYYSYDESCRQAKKRWRSNDNDDLMKKKKKSGKESFRLSKCSQQQQDGRKTRRRLRKGDIVNLSQILFTETRDFLITYKDRARPVQAKHMQGKFVVLHFVPLVPWTARLRLWVSSLVEVYEQLQPKGCFEVVFIGVEVDTNPLNSSLKDLFEEKFSTMPWTAIPLEDIQSIQTRLGFPVSRYIDAFTTFSFVIDPMGIVLQCGADDDFLLYGAPGFPFSDHKIQSLESQDKQLLKHPTITQLLTSPGCDCVINKDKQEVPVHHLEDKVVGLYFYENFPIDNTTEHILKAYEQVADKEKFEIVLVYLHNTFTTSGRASEESFWKSFNKMPWLALPFKDPRCSSLQLIFKYDKVFEDPDPDPRLVIIGPQGKFFDAYGHHILNVHGTKAYPFTRQRLAELAAEFVKKVRLDMLWDPNTYFRQKDGSKVKMSQLVGKRIILIVENSTHDWANLFPKFWCMLKARYFRMKGKDDGFEVISVTYKDKHPLFSLKSKDKDVASVPWLRHRPFGMKSKSLELLLRIFKEDYGLLAFDHDGRVVRRTSHPTIERGNMDFPFYSGSLEKELLKEINTKFEDDCYWFQGGFGWE